jgi:hypothetical protein
LTGTSKRSARVPARPKAFIKETSTSAKPLEILLVCFTTPKVQATDLEIGEELIAVVIPTSLRIKQPVEIRFWVYQVCVCCYKSTGL